MAFGKSDERKLFQLKEDELRYILGVKLDAVLNGLLLSNIINYFYAIINFNFQWHPTWLHFRKIHK